MVINYGEVTSAAVDPIEKKPLYHFKPGKNILSLGSFGCNMTCSFELVIQVGKFGFNIMPIRLTEEEICKLYEYYFHRELEDLSYMTQKEADFLENMICLYLREQFNNQQIIQKGVSDWIANGLR